VQLQNGIEALSGAGAVVYALSYDEADALRDFREAHGITYRLLSDPDSRVIREFGILNTLIAEDDVPWFGIPFPGAYVIDRAGVITHKFFESNLAVRAGPERFLRALGGEPAEVVRPTRDPDPTTEAQVFLEADTLVVSVQRELVARIAVPTGRHVYAKPAPPGSVEVDLQLDSNPSLVVRDLIRPESEPHRLASTGEEFEVHHGTVELRLPITVNGALAADGGTRETTISGTVCWQTCDDEVCDLPERQRFEIRVPIVGPVLPGIRRESEAAAREPNAAQHFQRLVERRTNQVE
jgi:hypothetical protein